MEINTGRESEAGEFGHMILVPEGKQCYCGKLGCADAYCAASALTNETYQTLEQFMKCLEKGKPVQKRFGRSI